MKTLFCQKKKDCKVNLNIWTQQCQNKPFCNSVLKCLPWNYHKSNKNNGLTDISDVNYQKSVIKRGPASLHLLGASVLELLQSARIARRSLPVNNQKAIIKTLHDNQFQWICRWHDDSVLAAPRTLISEKTPPSNDLDNDRPTPEGEVLPQHNIVFPHCQQFFVNV